MTESPWISEKEAIIEFQVDLKTLRAWRDVGYLKQGTHWRESARGKNYLFNNEVFYHLRWCKEEIDYWSSRDAPIKQIAA